jgi:hypothetical protein
MAKTLQIVIAGVDKGGTKVFKDVDDAAETTQGKLAAMGSKIGPGVAAAATAVVAGVAFAVKGAYDAAAESAKIGRETERVLQTTGASAWTTADQIGDLSTSLSELTGVDDELIQSTSNLLLTFTNIQNQLGENNDIFDQATALALDMSTVLGTDASGAAIQLGKALNDPVKGITALSRAGVSFTAEQKEQIKTLTASGDVLGAQKIILAELSREFGGAAEAAATPVDKLQTKLGNLQEQVGAQLIPVFDTVANIIGTVAEGFMNLPGPVQVVIEVLSLLGGGAFGATLLVSKLASTFADTLSPVLGFVKKFADDAALGIANIATKMGASQDGAANFASRLSGALGPALLGVGAVAVIGMGIFSMYQQSQKEAEERAKAFTDTLNENTGAITGNTTAAVRKKLEDNNQLDNLNRANVSVEQYTSALSDNSRELGIQESELRALAITGKTDTDYKRNLITQLREEGGARNDLIATLAENNALDSGLVGTIIEQTNAYDANQEAIRQKNIQAAVANGSSLKEAAAVADATAANIRHADSLKEVAAELRATTDPYFAAFRGLDQVKKAQAEYDKVNADGSKTDQEKKDAYIALAQAAAGYKGDLLELDEQNKRNGTSNDDLKNSLDGLAVFGLDRTGEAADNAKTDLYNLGTVADIVGSKSVNIPVTANITEAQRAIRELLGIIPAGLRGEWDGGGGFRLKPDGTRARGGPVSANGTYLVGEEGPELLRMGPSSGRVFSNPDSSRMLGGSSSVNVTINMPAGANGEDVVRALKQYERANGALYASA